MAKVTDRELWEAQRKMYTDKLKKLEAQATDPKESPENQRKALAALNALKRRESDSSALEEFYSITATPNNPDALFKMDL